MESIHIPQAERAHQLQQLQRCVSSDWKALGVANHKHRPKQVQVFHLLLVGLEDWKPTNNIIGLKFQHAPLQCYSVHIWFQFDISAASLNDTDKCSFIYGAYSVFLGAAFCQRNILYEDC